MSTPAQQKLDCLCQINRVLTSPADLTGALKETLRLLGGVLAINRGAISLLNPRTGQISLEAAFGLSSEEMARGRYSLGEGITGRVVATGRPLAVPKVSEEPLFLDRTQARQGLEEDISFICVPIQAPENLAGGPAQPDQAAKTLGALWVDRPGLEGSALDQEVDLLTLVAGLIAQSVAQLEAVRLAEENQRLKSQLATRFSAANLIGHSTAMHEVFALIDKVARSRTTVLLRGESGTGKGLAAAAIHYTSPRAKEPFIKVNCAALPQSLIESELFGHEKGAFTGALKAKPGKFELAQSGSVFLDEVGSLPPEAQAKLLRVLQEREVERLGGQRTKKVDVRVIAATNRNLEAALDQGQFREDLYYRLNVFPIHLPPLRERKTDILLLVDHFVDKYSRELDKDVRRVAPQAIDRLLAYHWPGNVRELENCIERAVLLTEERTIRPAHLPPSLQAAGPAAEPASLPQAVADLEQSLIKAALSRTKGNLAQAARELGLTQRMIGYKVRKYGLDPKPFASAGPPGRQTPALRKTGPE
ncbi:MAG: sigma 54-interacting transcriptional regulator [Deltaproteobacteria bacterium]|nr:sigma 54-interacting transcriptional regulator [Deltaproteobacteria bacterium]